MEYGKTCQLSGYRVSMIITMANLSDSSIQDVYCTLSQSIDLPEAPYTPLRICRVRGFHLIPIGLALDPRKKNRGTTRFKSGRNDVQVLWSAAVQLERRNPDYCSVGIAN
jgi:hypothetical protein